MWTTSDDTSDGRTTTGEDEAETKKSSPAGKVTTMTASTMGPSTMGSTKPEDNREGFSNGTEFILTCLGLAVGLGNIWRFPTMAYANGGSAFLIPYLTCALVFGLPAIYLEFLIGQYNGVSPPVIFRRIMPILEGVGWMGPLVSACVAIYYIVIISWISIFLFNIVRGHHNLWTNCGNEWNDPETCIDIVKTEELCGNWTETARTEIMTTLLPTTMAAATTALSNDTVVVGNDTVSGNITTAAAITMQTVASTVLTTITTDEPDTAKKIWINGACRTPKEFKALGFTPMSPTEQYFQFNVVKPSSGMFEFEEINVPVLIGMTVCWILTCLMILKGMKIMGKISYVTVLLPYAIVVILFFRGITLDGAGDGINFYLGQPDFSKILVAKTWVSAIKQLCFSLSVGHGGLMSMSSYSPKRNNCFKDACIVVGGDTVMSLVGGAGVFSTLGFLAKQRGVAVPDVVESGMTLAFVVYPEAMSQMPATVLWIFLFFFMLFLLGVSTEIALVEVVCSCFYDQFKSLRTKKHIVAPIWCFILYLIGLIFCTKSGIYWFEMFDEYSAGFSSVFTVVTEIIVIMAIYKYWNFREDIMEVMGPAKNMCTKIIGPHSPYFVVCWLVFTPLIGAGLVALAFDREYPFMGNADVYPWVFDVLGWLISFTPVLMVPLFAVINFIKFHKRGQTAALFKLQKQHASYARIAEKFTEEEQVLAKDLPDLEPWDENNDAAANNTNEPKI